MVPAPLSNNEAQNRLTKYGLNKIPDIPPKSLWQLLINQIINPLILILLAASVFTLILGEHLQTMVIMLAVFINTLLGFIQEYKAQKSLYALKSLIEPSAKVIREGKIVTIAAKLLVPGDHVQVKSGDKLPADGKFIECIDLYVNEAILSGESLPVKKSISTANSSAFMGCQVVSGRGKIIVTKTGTNTELGKISQTLFKTKEPVTPLQMKMLNLSRNLAYMVGGLSMIVFITSILLGYDLFSMLTTSVAIAVSAIPEGLSVSLTAILAIGMQRILKRNALVRKLVSAETLGSVTVICVDKTGTLTEGLMKVVHADTKNRDAYYCAAIANNLEDPIEHALFGWVLNNKLDPQKISEENPRKSEIVFTSERKFMAVATDTCVWVKGAPEKILSLSRLSNYQKEYYNDLIIKWAKKGYRLIALSKTRKVKKLTPDHIKNLDFLGLLAVFDPVRDGVSGALKLAKNAGISIKVITGDYKLTAQVIMEQLGLQITDPESEIMEGEELEHFTSNELSQKVNRIKLFCRTTPMQKLKIVEALQLKGESVAMTGDGVNDALALKKAEIAIVVESAPDVAKETADLVLLDSNFNTIIAAIEEGRVIYNNIKKIVLYLLSDSFSEISIIFVALLMKLPLPLTALQILWINIVSDGFPNLALAFEPKDRNLLRERPIPLNSPLIDLKVKLLIAVISVINVTLTIITYTFIYRVTGSQTYAQTLVFVMLGVNTLAVVYSCKTLNHSLRIRDLVNNPYLTIAVFSGLIFHLLPVYLPFLASIFELTSIKLIDYSFIALGAVILLLSTEGVKHLYSKFIKA